MSDPRDPHWPTTRLPVVEPRGVYRARNHRRILLVTTAATVAVVAVAVWAISPGDQDEPVAPIAAPLTTVSTAPPASVAEITATASPSPSPSKPPKSAPAQPVRPGQLVTRLMTVVKALEKRGELDDDGAKALNRRLESLRNRLRKDPDKAAGKLKDFVKKLADLREDEEISEDGFTALAAGATQISAVL